MVFRKKQHTAQKIAVGSAIAGAAGYLAGILTAPKAGKETRTDIANKAEEVKDNSEEQLQALNDELKTLIKDTKAKTIVLSSTARAELNEAVMKAKDAQNKTTQVLKAVKNGEASDPDLNKAVKQAHQAVKNLSKFFKNGE